MHEQKFNLDAMASLKNHKPTYFATPEQLRKWFEKNHEKADEFWVGYYKTNSGKPGITWPESVDQALCFGWIDGVRYSIDDKSYKIRFTPRKPKSIWSSINIKRVAELKKLGLMHASGLATFAERNVKKTKQYSHERSSAKLEGLYKKKFQADKKAWSFFSAQAPWYQKAAAWWVISAKQEATRLRRLYTLVADSAAGEKVYHLRRPVKIKKEGSGK